MCGIFLSEGAPASELILALLKNRGPTFFSEMRCEGIYAASSVLSIRGSVAQPVLGDDYILQYNGEIYNGMLSDTLYIQRVVEETIRESHSTPSRSGSDRKPFLSDNVRIHPSPTEEATAGSASGTDTAGQELQLLDDDTPLAESTGDELSRDFNFIESIYTKINKDENELALSLVRNRKAFFFKDDVGRRSIGIRRGPFALSSVCYEEELDPLRLYVYDFDKKQLFSRFKPLNGLTLLYGPWIGTVNHFIGSAKYAEQYMHLIGYGDDVGQKDACRNTMPETAAVDAFRAAFSKAIGSRLDNDPIIFFSGGVDSTLVALFAHLASPIDRTIYLVNTSFPDAFDRRAGLLSLEALRKVCTKRNFIFIKNDLSTGLIGRHGEEIRRLISPKTGMMDFNIAAVLYFSALAASKIGRVVLLGSGADEAFGGYGRYYARGVGSKEFVGGSFRGRMFWDLFTVSTHNICRDDRAISDRGVEARFPFLDTALLEMSLKLDDCWLIKDGENKRILRAVLRAHGLADAATVPKKAMQYGSGISKHEDKL